MTTLHNRRLALRVILDSYDAEGQFSWQCAQEALTRHGPVPLKDYSEALTVVTSFMNDSEQTAKRVQTPLPASPREECEACIAAMKQHLSGPAGPRAACCDRATDQALQVLRDRRYQHTLDETP